jgi:hypothetical protein
MPPSPPKRPYAIRGTMALYALKPLLDSFNNAFCED